MWQPPLPSSTYHSRFPLLDISHPTRGTSLYISNLDTCPCPCPLELHLHTWKLLIQLRLHWQRLRVRRCTRFPTTPSPCIHIQMKVCRNPTTLLTVQMSKCPDRPAIPTLTADYVCYTLCGFVCTGCYIHFSFVWMFHRPWFNLCSFPIGYCLWCCCHELSFMDQSHDCFAFYSNAKLQILISPLWWEIPLLDVKNKIEEEQCNYQNTIQETEKREY